MSSLAYFLYTLYKLNKENKKTPLKNPNITYQSPPSQYLIPLINSPSRLFSLNLLASNISGGNSDVSSSPYCAMLSSPGTPGSSILLSTCGSGVTFESSLWTYSPGSQLIKNQKYNQCIGISNNKLMSVNCVLGSPSQRWIYDLNSGRIMNSVTMNNCWTYSDNEIIIGTCTPSLSNQWLIT